jgi:hypothetical protein
MGVENLVPFSERTEDEQREIRSKGGKTMSPKRRVANTLNALKRSKDLTQEQKLFIGLVRDKDFSGLLCEILASNLVDADSFGKKAKLTDQIIKLLPNHNINLNVDAEQEAPDWKIIINEAAIKKDTCPKCGFKLYEDS